VELINSYCLNVPITTSVSVKKIRSSTILRLSKQARRQEILILRSKKVFFQALKTDLKSLYACNRESCPCLELTSSVSERTFSPIRPLAFLELYRHHFCTVRKRLKKGIGVQCTSPLSSRQ
jgi:hypothetical protein